MRLLKEFTEFGILTTLHYNTVQTNDRDIQNILKPFIHFSMKMIEFLNKMKV